MKKLILKLELICKLSIGIFLIFLCGSCSVLGQKKDTWTLLACDTIELPLKIQRVESFYMPEYNTQANSYFIYYPETHRYGFALCLDSINPTVIFPVSTQIQNYLIEDTNTFIYQSLLSNLSKNNFLKRVNRHGTVLDTLYFGSLGTMYEDTLILSSLGTLALPLHKTDTKRHYYAHTCLAKTVYNLTNFDIRCTLLQHPFIQDIIVSKDSVTSTQTSYTHYPKSYFSEQTSCSNWWPRIALNKNLDIVTSYFFIDSLFVTHTQNNSQEHFPVKSWHKTKPDELYDAKQRFDQVYRRQYACRTISYVYLHYDSYRDCYYQVATLPMPYENKDGTFNDAKDKPWSLIIVDSHYRQIGEIDMPDYLSKHDIMIVPQGIAIQNSVLSAAKEHPVYVIYKLEKK